MEPDAVEIRVLGCLIEKQRTTPDVYPLTLNALRLACNQSTNRDPVVDYDENTIRSGIERLVQRKWATLASWSNRRSMKYRHTLDGALGLADPEISVLTVLMLRGPQTPGELKTRTERLHSLRRHGRARRGTLDAADRARPRPCGSSGARVSARSATGTCSRRRARRRDRGGARPRDRCSAGRGRRRSRIERVERQLAELRAADSGPPRRARRLSFGAREAE